MEEKITCSQAEIEMKEKCAQPYPFTVYLHQANQSQL